jgi:putative spermidine/putrescine transport system permease protein
MRTDTVIRGIAAVISTFLITPIIIVVILSFSGDRFLTFPPTSLSLQWYAKFFGDPGWRNALYASLSVGLMTCLISTVIGFLGAYAFVRGRVPIRQVTLSFVLMPLIVPHIITAVALYFVSAPLGLVGSRMWMAIGHSVVAVPIVVLIIMSALQNVEANLERAALSLGASRAVVMRRIVLPLIAPGLMSAALFSFLASFDELIIALFLAGVASETLPVRIWNSLRLEVEPTIAAVSAFLIAVTVAVLLIDALVRKALSHADQTKSHV